ncbi:hypothetical protein [Siminovitchia terrae]|uniref:hypothetical protein n=1 Tax=Siminovitchia terrae TaxID=1914933 RepID=UPI001BB35623|nr:hypothetical protein [Siminovitchia terrae]
MGKERHDCRKNIRGRDTAEQVLLFNFIQQKSPTSLSGEKNANWYSIQWGFKPRLNKVKASGGCHRFSEEIYRAELDKIWAQIRQGAFDDIQ